MRKFKKLDSNIIFENQLSKDIPGLKKEALSSNSKSDRDKYINDIFNLFYEIHDKFEDLNIFYILLTSNIVWLWKSKLAISRCIKLHIEIYLVNQIAIMDRVLHLIDFLFELNIKPCNLKIENIEKTGKVPDEIISMLEDFNKQIKTIRNEQNSVKHQRSYSDNWLDDFSNSEFLITNTSEIDMKKSLKRKSPHLKIYLKELKRGSLKNNLIFSKFINSILNSLYSQHQLRLKAYTLIS